MLNCIQLDQEEEKKENNNYVLYKHTFPNGRVYIGITERKPEKRWGKNGNGYKSNKKMFEDIKKYQWENIKHEIIFSNLSKKEAGELEQLYIERYKANIEDYGYNKSKGGTLGPLGCKRSEETKKKLSQVHKGKPSWNKGIPNTWSKGYKMTPEIKEKISNSLKGKPNISSFKKIYQYTEKGEFIQSFNSITEAAKQIKGNVANISRSAADEHTKYMGFLWSYTNSPNFIFKHGNKNKNKPERMKKKVYQLDENKKILNTYDSITEASKILNINSGSISKAVKYNWKAGNFYWKLVTFEDENKVKAS